MVCVSKATNTGTQSDSQKLSALFQKYHVISERKTPKYYIDSNLFFKGRIYMTWVTRKCHRSLIGTCSNFITLETAINQFNLDFSSLQTRPKVVRNFVFGSNVRLLTREISLCCTLHIPLWFAEFLITLQCEGKLAWKK